MLMPLAIHARSIGHGDLHGVQRLHDVPTSRLGGIVVVVTCAITMAMVLSYGQDKGFVGLPLVLAVVPVVLLGLAEDVTRQVRPRYRMAAAVLSAMLASAYSGGIVPRLDLPFVDGLLQHMWFVLPLTWFMVAGACNAMKLIDGAHGLAGGTAPIMLWRHRARGGTSADSDADATTVVVMGASSASCAGLPAGRVFLGDAGAYFIGFMYAELSIQLSRATAKSRRGTSSCSPASLIVDTLFAMYRRGGAPRAADGAGCAPPASLVFRRIALPIERRQTSMNLARANRASRRGCGSTAFFAWRWPCSSMTIRLRRGQPRGTPAFYVRSVSGQLFRGGARAFRGAAKGTTLVKRSNVL
jgi:UDP-N-acetylmuramyl pentapeptide phosphotransferase/UDP-N-acetylglucosamine-1-phosphate transferase